MPLRLFNILPRGNLALELTGNGQPLSAFGAASFQDISAVYSGIPFPESMLVAAFPVGRLICPFHYYLLVFYIITVTVFELRKPGRSEYS